MGHAHQRRRRAPLDSTPSSAIGSAGPSAAYDASGRHLGDGRVGRRPCHRAAANEPSVGGAQLHDDLAKRDRRTPSRPPASRVTVATAGPITVTGTCRADRRVVGHLHDDVAVPFVTAGDVPDRGRLSRPRCSTTTTAPSATWDCAASPSASPVWPSSSVSDAGATKTAGGSGFGQSHRQLHRAQWPAASNALSAPQPHPILRARFTCRTATRGTTRGPRRAREGW